MYFSEALIKALKNRCEEIALPLERSLFGIRCTHLANNMDPWFFACTRKGAPYAFGDKAVLGGLKIIPEWCYAGSPYDRWYLIGGSVSVKDVTPGDVPHPITKGEIESSNICYAPKDADDKRRKRIYLANEIVSMKTHNNISGKISGRTIDEVANTLVEQLVIIDDTVSNFLTRVKLFKAAKR